MVSLTPDKIFGVKIVITVLHATVNAFAASRLVHRLNIQKAGGDDYAAVAAALFDGVYAVLLWFRVGESFTAPNGGGPIHPFWGGIFLFLTAIWLTRVSICWTLARIFPPRHPSRIMSLVAMTFMVLAYTLDDLHCLRRPGGFTTAGSFVNFSNIFGDALLICMQFATLWHLKCPTPTVRFLVRCSSFSNAFTMIAGVMLVLFTNGHIDLGSNANFILTLMRNIEVILALFVCNFMILSNYLYALIRRRRLRLREPPASEVQSVSQRQSQISLSARRTQPDFGSFIQLTSVHTDIDYPTQPINSIPPSSLFAVTECIRGNWNPDVL
ncbi:hypothetical protein GALMADRAFT_139067 [Galerina marginata CBS 339.88]|uniref:Rhodopsin domain-containing protein n=1 Tax=Galerina marginata (strain CBS 339.88) TaxID=685588 RepID=A0A067T3Z8_GALM3|nr:hypothetical protein GALMADRAFT_139067 [Galerina marginata CBS 339.88]